jgi:hypothetical protein
VTSAADPTTPLSVIDASELPARLAQFAPARLGADIAHLPDAERAALGKLIEAARLLEPAFDRQVWAGYAELEAALVRDPSPSGQARLAYFRLMRGPWDRQDEHRPFVGGELGVGERPRGAGFYPEDLTAEQLRAHVAAHPELQAALEGLFTMVVRDGNTLRAAPYSEVFRAQLEPAAGLLREAAALTRNATLAAFLEARAAAFLSDDYYASDKAWMDLDSPVEVTIGPYETYEDELLGLKASFAAFVTVTDPAASAALGKYKSMLPAMEANLPVPDDIRAARGSESPIRVVDLVYSAGDARKSVQTIAFNLPNDERVRAEKGAKKVLLRNVITTKFDLIMAPIAARIIAPEQLGFLSAEAFFNETLFHELSHSLGPAFVSPNPGQTGQAGQSGQAEPVEVRVALGATYSHIEEAKADVMGAYNVLFMIRRGEFPAAFREQLLLSYFAGLFRSTRFGIAEAHGKGAAVQINRFLEERAASFDEAKGTFSVDFDALEASITRLVRDICVLQAAGDRAAAEAMLATYGVMSPPMTAALGKLGGIPIDIRPIYPVAGE